MESRAGLVDARRGSPASRPGVGDARDPHEDVANRLGARRRGDAVQSFIAGGGFVDAADAERVKVVVMVVVVAGGWGIARWRGRE